MTPGDAASVRLIPPSALDAEVCPPGSKSLTNRALLLAGARPDHITAALLLPGRGLSGGGAQPDLDRAPERAESWRARIESSARSYDPDADPMVSECERDLRPIDYAASFASAARRLLFSEVVEAAGEAPPWWQAARDESGGPSASVDLSVAFSQLQALSLE